MTRKASLRASTGGSDFREMARDMAMGLKSFKGTSTAAGEETDGGNMGSNGKLPLPPLVLIGPYEHHSSILPWLEAGADILMLPDSRVLNGGHSSSHRSGPDLRVLERVLRVATDGGRMPPSELVSPCSLTPLPPVGPFGDLDEHVDEAGR